MQSCRVRHFTTVLYKVPARPGRCHRTPRLTRRRTTPGRYAPSTSLTHGGRSRRIRNARHLHMPGHGLEARTRMSRSAGVINTDGRRRKLALPPNLIKPAARPLAPAAPRRNICAHVPSPVRGGSPLLDAVQCHARRAGALPLRHAEGARTAGAIPPLPSDAMHSARPAGVWVPGWRPCGSVELRSTSPR